MTYINRFLRFIVRPEKDYTNSNMTTTPADVYFADKQYAAQWNAYFKAKRSDDRADVWVDRSMFKTDPVVIDPADYGDWFYLDYHTQRKRIIETDDAVVRGKIVQVCHERHVVDYVWGYSDLFTTPVSLSHTPLFVRKESDYCTREIGYKGVHVLSDPVNKPDFKDPSVFMPLTILELGTDAMVLPKPLRGGVELPSVVYSAIAYTSPAFEVSGSDSTSGESMSVSSFTDDDEAKFSPGILSILNE